jgi:hypothetical protein
MDESVVKREFDEWMELLRTTGNQDMLKDPYNIWLEAWSIAEFLRKQKDETKKSSDNKSVV